MTLPKITEAEADELLGQHTKGPWKADVRLGCVAVYPANIDHNCLAIHQDNFIHYKGGERDERDMPTISEEKIANAKRIVACVNACTGMADPEAEIAQLRQDKAELLLTLQESDRMLAARFDKKDSWVIKVHGIIKAALQYVQSNV